MAGTSGNAAARGLKAARTALVHAIERRGIDHIPAGDRRGKPAHLGLMWAAATTNVFPVIYGAILISLGLSWIQAAIVIVVADLSFLLVGLASLVGPLAGTTTFAASRAAFGLNGNRGIALLNWTLQIGFETLGISTATLAALVLLGKIGIGSTTTTKVAVVVLATGLQATLPLVGHAAVVKLLNWLAIPFIGMFVLFGILAKDKIRVTSGGSHAGFSTLAIAFALVLSAGGLSYVTNAADYSRYLPETVRKGSLVLWVTVGSFVPWTILQLLGAAVATGIKNASDPISGLPKVFPSWFLVPYLVLLIVQVEAANSFLLYSSGVTLQALGLNIARWKTVILDTVVVAGLVLAITFASSFNTFVTDFLLFMLIWFAPWTAIFLLDLFLRRGNYDVAGLMATSNGAYWRIGGFHVAGVVAQLAGMAAAASWINTSVWTGPLATATGGADMSVWSGFVVGGVTYLLLGGKTVRREARGAQLTASS